jgi:hypothetical protein
MPAALAGSLVLAAITGAIRAMTVRVWVEASQALRQGTRSPVPEREGPQGLLRVGRIQRGPDAADRLRLRLGQHRLGRGFSV